MAQAKTKTTPAAPGTTLDDQPEISRALQHLRDRVESQLRRHERRLPAERELAAELGLGRSAIRAALAILEADGVVIRHVGRGTFIAGGAQVASRQLHALTTQGALAIDTAQGVSPRELMETRLALEPAMAELAALAARPNEIAEMRECLRQREESTALDAYEHWDHELHMCIARSTRNAMLIELLELVNRLRRTGGWRDLRRASILPGERRASNAQHRRIVDAIARADAPGAFAAMRSHLATVSNHYLQQTYTDEHARLPHATRKVRR
jgi:DNA-binding FadR family transcriptional regulator